MSAVGFVAKTTEDMYSFFGLSQPAFGPVRSPGQIFRSGLVGPVVKEVMAGCDVLSVRGRSGVGKTTFMHLLAMEFEARTLSAVVVGGVGSTPSDVHRLIAPAGQLSPGSADANELVRGLWSRAGLKRLVLLCDNAETLPADTFRFLSMLVKLRVRQAARIQLVLLGEAGPWAGLAHPDLDQLRQATQSRYITFSLRESEASAYLDHKLRYAGQPLRRVMTESATAALRTHAHGNPQKLDELAEQALLHGYRTGRRRLTARTVRQAISAGEDQIIAVRRRNAVTLVAGMTILAAAAIGALVLRADMPGARKRALLPQTSAPAGAAAVRPTPPSVAGTDRPASAAIVAVPARTALPASPRPKATPIARGAGQVGNGPGLALIVGPGDDMPSLYAKVYRGLVPPPYASLLAANPVPLKPGVLVVFPAPPNGWTRQQ